MAIYQTSVIERKQVANNTVEISFKRPHRFSYKAGQYVQIGVPTLLHPDSKGASRVFSIVSSPLEKEKLSVAFRDTGSGFKRTLKELPLGAPAKIEGPHGFFTLPQNPPLPLIFMAGGIGVTPYVSMIRCSAENGSAFPMKLLYANKNKESAAYLEELQDISNRHEHFTLKNKFGKVNEGFIRQHVKDVREYIWHISGPPAMVDYVRNTLFLSGVDYGRVHFEEFVGYG